MKARSVVKAHRSITVFNTEDTEWEVEVAEPKPISVFRFPDDSEED